MTTIKLQHILLLIVVLCFLLSTKDTIEPITAQWSNFLTAGTGPPSAPTATSDPVCTDSHISGITDCKVSSDDCFNSVTKTFKNPGDDCSVNNVLGKCRDYQDKLSCMVEPADLSQGIQTNLGGTTSTPQPAPASSENVYVIIKNGENKTHAPTCSESSSNTLCSSIITTAGTADCTGNRGDCCLCNSNTTSKWNKIYTSKYGDSLTPKTPSASKTLSDLPNLFTDHSSNRSAYSVIQVSNNNYGIYTARDPTDLKRYFKIRDNVNNNAPDNKYYSPNKGYFLDSNNETTFPLSEYPGYIQSSSNSQLQSDFFFEECLYTQDSSGLCQCGQNQTPDSNDPHTLNRVCTGCPAGQVLSGSSCSPCSDNNKVIDASGACSPCPSSVGAGDKLVYRESSDGSGVCKHVNSNVPNSGVIRSDCVPKSGANTNTCRVLNYVGESGGSDPLYHLSTNQSKTITDYYAACDAVSSSGGSLGCEVVQSLIGDNTNSVEAYVNFDNGPIGIHMPANFTTDANFKPEFNMITNEYCRDIDDETKCNELKHCKWSQDQYSAVTATQVATQTGQAGSPTAQTTGTCLLDPKYNQYNHRNINYHFIPLPSFKATIDANDTINNPLTTDCSGRIQSECTASNKCNWTGSACESICNTKNNQNSCNLENSCQWNSSTSTCSKKTSISCGVPSITTTDRYKSSNSNLGNIPSENLFNSNVSCKGLLDQSSGEYSGDAKGICFSSPPVTVQNSSQYKMEKTGCISSNIINNLTLYKNPSTISTANTNASTPPQDPLLPNSALLNATNNIPYALPSQTQIDAPFLCESYHTCDLYSEITVPPIQDQVSQPPPPAPQPYTELSNVPMLINRCRELCVKNSDICNDYGVKFPSDMSPSSNTDAGCYLLNGANNKATIEVTFDAPVTTRYNVKYYPCTIKLKATEVDSGGNAKLPGNIKNVVGIIGTKSHPLKIPYIRTLYNGQNSPSLFQLNKTDFNINIPGLNSDSFRGFKLSGDDRGGLNITDAVHTTIQNGGSVDWSNIILPTPNDGTLPTTFTNEQTDSVDIKLPHCGPSSSLGTNWATGQSVWSEATECYNNDSNLGNITDIVHYINTRGREGRLDSNLSPTCPASCSTISPTPTDITSIKQFKLGSGAENIFFYEDMRNIYNFIGTNSGLYSSHHRPIKNISGGTNASLFDPNSQSIVWGFGENFTYADNINPTTTATDNANYPYIKRMEQLIRPNRIHTDKGGIIKQNHNSDESGGDIEIMKLYLLEGSPVMRINLIGKRLGNENDWYIPNIVLPITGNPDGSLNRQAPRSYKIEYDIHDAFNCYCPNGSVPDDCTANSSASSYSCASCDAGYQLNNNQCVAPPTCTCPNGTAATGADCTTDGATICTSCDAGYHPAGNTCVANTCTCSNGTAATAAACTTDGASVCASCDAGYHPAGNTCVANTCTCNQGTPATGAACTTDGATICTSCDAGYHPDGNACVANTCTCSNGTAATGAACTTDGASVCASCDAGYHPDGNACVANTCTCNQGTPATGAACTTDGAEICASCNNMYPPNNNLCAICGCMAGGHRYELGKTGQSCPSSNTITGCIRCPGSMQLKTSPGGTPVVDGETTCNNNTANCVCE